MELSLWYEYAFYNKMRYKFKNMICILLLEFPKNSTYILLNLHNSYSHYFHYLKMKDWDSEQLNDLPKIPQLVIGKLEFEYPVLFCCLYKQKKIFLSCSLIYKSIDVDMYKILFNPHANPERELLLFIQMAHWSEAIECFRTCPRSISTQPWRLESNPIVQGDEAVSISYNVLVKMKCIEQNLGKGGYEEIPRTLSAKETNQWEQRAGR